MKPTIKFVLHRINGTDKNFFKMEQITEKAKEPITGGTEPSLVL